MIFFLYQNGSVLIYCMYTQYYARPSTNNKNLQGNLLTDMTLSLHSEACMYMSRNQ